MSAPRTIERLRPRYVETINPVASLGFIGLATDRASFRDFSDFVAPFAGVAAHATRIPFVEEATPETLAAMGDHLKGGAAMLVPGQPLQSISFSCTSGTIAIGTDRVRREINSIRPESVVATPIEAAVEALRLLKCPRLSLLVPYLISTTQMVADYFETAGFQLDRIATFDLGGDPDMNRVDAECIYEAGIALCDKQSDALFISCTGWRTFAVIDRLEKALGRPVVSSNQALAWKALRSAGVTSKVFGQGRLFAEH